MLNAVIWTQEKVWIENHEDMVDRKLIIDNVQIVVFSKESGNPFHCVMIGAKLSEYNFLLTNGIHKKRGWFNCEGSMISLSFKRFNFGRKNGAHLNIYHVSRDWFAILRLKDVVWKTSHLTWGLKNDFVLRKVWRVRDRQLQTGYSSTSPFWHTII